MILCDIIVLFRFYAALRYGSSAVYDKTAGRSQLDRFIIRNDNTASLSESQDRAYERNSLEFCRKISSSKYEITSCQMIVRFWSDKNLVIS